MGDWMAALDAQLDLIRFWRSNRPDARMAAARALCFIHDPDLGEPELHEWLDREVPDLQWTMADSLDRGGTYWASAEMGRFLSYAQQDFPEHPLRYEDVPSISGFLHFEEPMEFYLASGNEAPVTVLVRSVHWSQLSTRLDAQDPNDGAAVFLSFYVDDLSEPYAFSVLGLGHAPVDTPQRTFQAFLALSRQRIALTEHRPPTRHGRRRAERIGFKIPEDGIRVITLRRPENQSPSDARGRVDWSHRWIVSGHWRSQWYPASGEHRPRWIDAYRKGPEDKPLVLKDSVYRWVQ